MTDIADRSRTFAWSDPMISAASARERAGVDVLRDVRDGRLPAAPIASLVGFDLVGVDEGRVEFALVPEEFHYNPIGSVHGGVYATLLDSAAGCAVHSLLPAGVGYTSLDLNVRFLRGLTPDSGAVRCVGTVTHLGRRTALAEARIVDTEERLYATATSSCMILRP